MRGLNGREGWADKVVGCSSSGCWPNCSSEGIAWLRWLVEGLWELLLGRTPCSSNVVCSVVGVNEEWGRERGGSWTADRGRGKSSQHDYK